MQQVLQVTRSETDAMKSARQRERDIKRLGVEAYRKRNRQRVRAYRKRTKNEYDLAHYQARKRLIQRHADEFAKLLDEERATIRRERAK